MPMRKGKPYVESYSSNFDADPAGSAPGGWARAGAGVGVPTQNMVVSSVVAASPPNAVCWQPSGAGQRSWIACPGVFSGNVEVSASNVTTSNALGVFARGSGMGSASTANAYYALASRSTGYVLTVGKLTDGALSTLVAVMGPSASGGLRTNILLRVAGGRIKARLGYRLGGSDLYLKADGTTSNDPGTWTADVADATFATGSMAGIIGSRVNNNPAYADDFAAADYAGDFTDPTIAISSSADGTTASGDVPIAVTAADDVALVRAEILVEGEVVRTHYGPGPYPDYLYDTRRRPADGPFVITARAFDASGNSATSPSVTIIGSNGTAPMSVPPITPKQPWMRRGLICGSSADAHRYPLATADWCRAGSGTEAALAAAAPGLPLVRYENVSNNYFGYLLAWYKYADTHGHARNQLFLHCYPSAWTSGTDGITNSVRASALLWNIRLVPASGPEVDRTDAGSDATAGDVALGNAVGDALVLGYPERFRELNFTWSRPPDGGFWSGEFEYRTKDGWAPLTLESNSDTDIAFEPPADWAAADHAGGLASAMDAAGNSYLYYVRLRTTTMGVPPIASHILGANWTGIDPLKPGSPTGVSTVRPFDYEADKDGDGYLNPTEWESRRPGFDARFEYQSHLHTAYGDWRAVTNPTSAAVRDFYVAYFGERYAAEPYTRWIFFDNGSRESGPPTREFGGTWPADLYTRDIGTLYRRIAQLDPIDFAYCNVAGLSDLRRKVLASVFPCVHTEAFLAPYADGRAGYDTGVAQTEFFRSVGMIFSTMNVDDSDISLEWEDSVVALPAPTEHQFSLAASRTDRTYVGAYARFLTGPLVVDGPRLISGYDRTARRLTVATAWSQAPSAGDRCVISGDRPDGTIVVGKEIYSGWASDHALLTGTSGGRGYQNRRIRMLAVAIYYLLQEHVFWFQVGNAQPTSAEEATIPEIHLDVGQPVDVMASDWMPPEDPTGATYRMVRRKYEKALVVFRPKINRGGGANSGDSVGHDSAVTFTLDAPHRLMVSDLSRPEGFRLEPAATTVTLRRADAAILVPENIEEPPPVDPPPVDPPPVDPPPVDPPPVDPPPVDPPPEPEPEPEPEPPPGPEDVATLILRPGARLLIIVADDEPAPDDPPV
jgi:hypothetical protein